MCMCCDGTACSCSCSCSSLCILPCLIIYPRLFIYHHPTHISCMEAFEGIAGSMACSTTVYVAFITDSYAALGDSSPRAVMMLWCSLARGTAVSRLVFGVSRPPISPACEVPKCKVPPTLHTHHKLAFLPLHFSLCSVKIQG